MDTPVGAGNALLPRAYAYVRLSRADLAKTGETIEQKLEYRKAICRRLAAENGLALAEEDIITEVVSGSTITARPGVQQILALAHAKALPHLITPFQDRLLRGDKADESRIEDALVLGNVTLYSADGNIHFHADYDPLAYEVKGLIARQELRNYAKRIRQTALSKLDVGQRYSGMAPYGYRHVPAIYNESGDLVKPARHISVPEELEIAREVFRRAQAGEKIRTLCRDLIARGVPPPGLGRRTNASAFWHPSTLRQMLHNPFYAGRLAQTQRKIRGRVVQLAPTEIVLARVDGDWETILALEEWYALQERLRTSGGPGHGRVPRTAHETPGLLTGILRGSCGRPMSVCRSDYTCRCGMMLEGVSHASGVRPGHPSSNIMRAKADDWARLIVGIVLDRLPDSVLVGGPRKSTEVGGGVGGAAQAAKRMVQIHTELEELQRQSTDMMLRRDAHVAMYGEEAYNVAGDRVGAKMRDLRVELAELEQVVAAPDLGELLPRLARVRQLGGAEALWQSGTPQVQKAVLAGFLRRLEVQEEMRDLSRWRRDGGVVVVWHAWVQSHLPDDLPPVPGYRRDAATWRIEARRVWEEAHL